MHSKALGVTLALLLVLLTSTACTGTKAQDPIVGTWAWRSVTTTGPVYSQKARYFPNGTLEVWAWSKDGRLVTHHADFVWGRQGDHYIAGGGMAKTVRVRGDTMSLDGGPFDWHRARN